MLGIFSAEARGKWFQQTAVAFLWVLFIPVNVVSPATAEEAEERVSPYAPRTDWSRMNEGELNISRFIYRDRNRNGVYDIGDRPLASIMVEMSAPDGGETVRRSNVNGFANFKMSLSEKADIGGPGEFSFRVIAPPRWEITSGNVEEASSFMILAGSPADIVTQAPPTSVGLAPQVGISGRLVERTEHMVLQPVADASLLATTPDGNSIDVKVGDDGTFHIPAFEGTWRLVARTPSSNAIVRRDVVVREAPVRLSTIVFGDPERAPAPRTVELDFEDVSRSVLAKIPSGVAGITWDNMNVTEALFYNGEGYVNATTSGHYVAYNSSGHPVTISSNDPFDFVGAYFGVAWRVAEGEQLLIRAWRDGEPIGEEIIGLSSLGPVWFDAEYRQINRLTIATGRYWQFVTDDMVIRVNPPGP